MEKVTVKLKNSHSETTEDDFGSLLHELELLNESCTYYKTMIKHD